MSYLVDDLAHLHNLFAAKDELRPSMFASELTRAAFMSHGRRTANVRNWIHGEVDKIRLFLMGNEHDWQLVCWVIPMVNCVVHELDHFVFSVKGLVESKWHDPLAPASERIGDDASHSRGSFARKGNIVKLQPVQLQPVQLQP